MMHLKNAHVSNFSFFAYNYFYRLVASEYYFYLKKFKLLENSKQDYFLLIFNLVSLVVFNISHMYLNSDMFFLQNKPTLTPLFCSYWSFFSEAYLSKKIFSDVIVYFF